MKHPITFCDSCGAQMSDKTHRGDIYGVRLQYVEPSQYVFISRNTKDSYGSSSKGAYLHGVDFCSERCLAHELTKALKECGLKLQVTPILEVKS